jgi:acyl-coenzyme A synthetase/AMP-(fatty) acid ligase
VPRYVEVVSALPKGPTGKTLKNELRAAGNGPRTFDAERGAYLSAR